MQKQMIPRFVPGLWALGFVLVLVWADARLCAFADDPPTASQSNSPGIEVTPGFDPPIETTVFSCARDAIERTSWKEYVRKWGAAAGPVLIRMYEDKSNRFDKRTLLKFMGEVGTDDVKAFFAKQFRAVVIGKQEYESEEARLLFEAPGSLIGGEVLELAMEAVKKPIKKPCSPGNMAAERPLVHLLAESRRPKALATLDDVILHGPSGLAYTCAAELGEIDPGRALRVAGRALAKSKDEFLKESLGAYFVFGSDHIRAKLPLTHTSDGSKLQAAVKKYEERLQEKTPHKKSRKDAGNIDEMLESWASCYSLYKSLDDAPDVDTGMRKEMAAYVAQGIRQHARKSKIAPDDPAFLAEAAAKLNDRDIAPALLEHLRSEDNGFADSAQSGLFLASKMVSAYVALAGKDATEPLLSIVDDARLLPEKRRVAVMGLAQIGGDAALRKLNELYSEGRRRVVGRKENKRCTHAEKIAEASLILSKILFETASAEPLCVREDEWPATVSADYSEGVFFDHSGRLSTMQQRYKLRRFGREWFVTEAEPFPTIPPWMRLMNCLPPGA